MEPDVLVATIIQTYMDLPDDMIWLKSQGIKAPTGEEDLWAVVGIRGFRILGQKGFLDPDTEEDVQQTSIMTAIDIDLASRDESATLRNWEVFSAFDSIPGKELMEANGVQVYRIPDPVDLSAVEGGGTLRRYRNSVIVSGMREKRKSTSLIFDKFSLEENNE